MNQNKKLIILFIVIYITSYQAAAEESGLPIILETNVYSLINKDVLSHVDTNRLDTRGTTDMRFYWSPDERKVLIDASIAAYEKGGREPIEPGVVGALYLADISQINSPKLLRWGEDTKITADDSRSMLGPFHWSPSGKYFSFLERSGLPFRQGYDEVWTLWIINASTLNVVSKKDVSPEPIGGDFNRGYSWSPIEDKIAYIGFDESKSKDIFIWDVSENSFYETGIKEYIKSFENTVLTWSPDGRKLALAGQIYKAENYSLLIIDPASRKITNLLSAAIIIAPRYAFWSPDSRNILVTEVKLDDEIIDVYLVNMENGEHRILTTLNNLASYVIKWSMDGKKFLFKTSKGDINQFYSMDIDGSSPPVLIFENNRSLESADVSGNFTILTFRSDSYNLKNLIVLENENKPLVINNVSYYHLNYTLDSLLYVSQNDGQNTLFRVSPGAGSKQFSILPDIKIFSFSPGGNFIIMDNGSESFEKVNNSLINFTTQNIDSSKDSGLIEKENSSGTNLTTKKADNSKGSVPEASGLAFIFVGASVFAVYYIIKMKRFL